MRAFGCVCIVGRTLCSTTVAGFAPVSASRHFASSSQMTMMEVKPLTPEMLAGKTRNPTRPSSIWEAFDMPVTGSYSTPSTFRTALMVRSRPCASSRFAETTATNPVSPGGTA